MKLNQAIEKLIENPKDVYEIFSAGKRHVLSVTDNGYFDFRTLSEGKELCRSQGGAWFGGNVSVSSDWQLVRQSVDFMTAANSGKKFKPESWATHNGGEDEFRDLHDNLAMFKGRACLNKATLNGKWFIAD